MHSASDIAVFVLSGDPDDGRHDGRPVAHRHAGARLASFMAREGVPHDFPLFLENGRRLLAQRERIRTLLPGHSVRAFSFPGFEARLKYVEALVKGVGKLAKEGRPLEEVLAAFPLEARFPDPRRAPASAPGTISQSFRRSGHDGLRNGATEPLHRGGAPEEKVRAVVADRGSKSPKYYFLEREVNGRRLRPPAAEEGV